MATTARSGRTRRRTWHGGHHDHRHVYAHPQCATRRGPSAHRAPAWRLLVCSWRSPLVGGGFWVLATYGKKVVTAPGGESHPTVLDQGSGGLCARARGRGEGRRDPGARDRLGDQLAALQRKCRRSGRSWRRSSGRPPQRPPGTEGGARRAGPGEGARVDAHIVSHDLKEATDGPKASEYTLAPGATKLPCILETTIISDVEGHFTCRVTTNVYDTATGRHLLVPQGSTVLGNDQANTLVYGSNRMDTVSLTLALPDGRTVDLGRAPVTDQPGRGGPDRAT